MTTGGEEYHQTALVDTRWKPMWDQGSNEEAMWEQLYQLATLSSVPEFMQRFYGLLVEGAQEAEDTCGQELTLQLLQIETRYYRQKEALEESQTRARAKADSAAEKRNIALAVLYEQVQARGLCSDLSAEITQQLIMAECSYHLGRYDALVAHLERALEAGAAEPLIYFALGYARFMLALESFVRLELPGAEFVIARQDTVQQLCRAAVTAFEGALTGSPQDTEVLWWIGRALLTADFVGEAENVLAQVEGPEPDEEEEWESEEVKRDQALRALEPITEQELAQFVEALKRPHPISNLL